jgi:hypothetical protein
MQWYRAACPVCSADLYEDLDEKGWVVCVACARSFIKGDLLSTHRQDRQPQTTELPRAS